MRFASLRPNPQRAFRLEGERVLLRPPQLGDWQVWSQLRAGSREFLTPWEPSWPHDALTRAAFRRRVRAYDREWQQGTGYSFLVFRLDQETALLGGVTLTNLRRGVAQSVSLGYWIGQSHARQGFMTDALGAVLGFCFDDLGLHRVEAACLPDNTASAGLLRKLGFNAEGHAREYLRINGRWQDHDLFAILRGDWRN